jgi:hypothetical protein
MISSICSAPPERTDRRHGNGDELLDFRRVLDVDALLEKHARMRNRENLVHVIVPCRDVDEIDVGFKGPRKAYAFLDPVAAVISLGAADAHLDGKPRADGTPNSLHHGKRHTHTVLKAASHLSARVFEIGDIH